MIILILCCVPQVNAQKQKYEVLAPWPTKAWASTSPETVGFDPVALNEAEQMYPRLFPSGYSLLVIRNGYLVSESYFHGQTDETTNHVYSITKTFVATLLGIAIEQGWIKDVHEHVADLLPEYPLHPMLTELTLEDILTHRSGVRNDRSFEDVELLLKAEPQSLPGTTFEYNNYAPNLLTAILDRQVNERNLKNGPTDLSTMAQKFLFEPLGIQISAWDSVPNGVPEGANGLHMTARDMARLGYLLLRNGYWEDAQLLPNWWVKEASEHRVSFDRQKGYGYLNWVRRRTDKVQTELGEQEIQGFFGYGHRGQFIGIYPELDLLVVTTADASDSTRDTFFVPDLLHDFIRRFVFSALTDPSKKIVGEKE